jgi:hypothetical protein
MLRMADARVNEYGERNGRRGPAIAGKQICVVAGAGHRARIVRAQEKRIEHGSSAVSQLKCNHENTKARKTI